MDTNTYGVSTVIRATESPSLLLEDDGSWTLLLEDAGAAVVLDASQVRKISDDYLSQQLGGPFEDD